MAAVEVGEGVGAEHVQVGHREAVDSRAKRQRGDRAHSHSAESARRARAPRTRCETPGAPGTALNLHVTMSKKFSELSKLIKRNLLCKLVKYVAKCVRRYVVIELC